jgi:hypothetical protein
LARSKPALEPQIVRDHNAGIPMMRFRSNLLLAAAFVATSSLSASAQVATASVIGRWGGVADVVVNWTKQRTLPINIVIGADDQATGTVGDATLVRGRLLRNRGWLGRAMQIKTDYIIEADLDGPIIRAENIQRDMIQIPFNARDGRLVGSVNSSGYKIGDAAAMVFTAKFVLLRAPELIICDR